MSQEQYPSNLSVILAAVAFMLLTPFIWIWAIGTGMWDSARRVCR